MQLAGGRDATVRPREWLVAAREALGRAFDSATGGAAAECVARAGWRASRPRRVAPKNGDEVVGVLNSVASLRAKLLAARNRRPQPLRDDKIVIGINGLAIDALVRTGQVLGRPRDFDAATLTAERLWTLAYNPKSSRLKHEIFHGRAQTDAYLDDYALLGRSFMSLYDPTKNPVWKERAGALAEAVARHFLQEDGRLSTSPNERELLIVPQDHGDDVYGSAAIDLLLRIGAATGTSRHTSLADRILGYVGGGVTDNPDGWGHAARRGQPPSDGRRITGKRDGAALRTRGAEPRPRQLPLDSESPR